MTPTDRWPLLPLDTWRDILHYHPYHFWQLAGTATPLAGAAGGLLREHAWQTADMVGRAEIREAILTAEDRLREYLGYSPAPRAVSEVLPWPRLEDRFLVRANSNDPAGRYVSVTLSEGQVQAVGYDTLTSLGTVNVTYSDLDGDGVNDSFSCQIATTETDITRIEAYFSSGDQFDPTQPTERWRISPVKVTIANGIATIRGRSWLLVKPVLYEGLQYVSSSATDTSGALDPRTSTNFVSTLDIYTHTTDPNGTTTDTSQAVLIWETRPCVGSWCLYNPQASATYLPSNSAFDPAAQAFAVARCGIRDAQLGIVTPAEATRDATTGIWSQLRFDPLYEPDRVLVRYRAGQPLDPATGLMPNAWATIVARLAAAELTRPIAAVDAANRELYRWQFDLARGGGRSEEQFQISPGDLDNPLGTKAGQVWAWKQIRNLRLLRGSLAG